MGMLPTAIYVVCGTVPHRTSKAFHYKNRFGSSQMHGSGLINYYCQMKTCICMQVRCCDLVYVFIICVASHDPNWTGCGFVYSVNAKGMTKGNYLA